METEFQEATCKKQPNIWHTIRAVPNQKFGSYDLIEEMNFSLLANKATTKLQVQLEGRANSLYKRLESRISKMQNNGFRSDESKSHGYF